MRDWGKVSADFWSRGSGKRLRGEYLAQVVALHLVTCRWSNSLGVFYIPLASLASEIGSPLEGALAGLSVVTEAGFAYYDRASEMVWIPNHAEVEIGKALKPGDKRRPYIQEELESLGNHPFAVSFWEKYGEAYGLEKPKALARPFEGACFLVESPSQAKAKQSKAKQEYGIGITRESEKNPNPPDPETEHSKTPTAPAAPQPGYSEAVAAWFAGYREVYTRDPVWGAIQGRQLKNAMRSCDDGETPELIGQYFHGPYPDSIRDGHPLSDGYACFVKRIPMLRADLANPQRRARAAVLSTRIRQAERGASNDDAAEEAARRLEAKANGGGNGQTD